MNKGYETSTIFKFLACLIALVIIVYLIYKYVAKTPISKQQCEALLSSWCTRCAVANQGRDTWSGGQGMGEDLRECHDLYGVPSEIKDDCSNAKNSVCAGYLIGD